MAIKSIYLIGSLRNPQVPILANEVRALGFDVFEDWFSSGPEADDYWQKYEQERGHDYSEALEGYAAAHVYEYDLYHLNRCDMAILLLPAGKSGHLEFGYIRGAGKKGYILFDKVPERWDVMYKFSNRVFFNKEKLFVELEKQK